MSISRRSLLRTGASLIAAPGILKIANASKGESSESARVINVVNFIRGVEPREPVDLFEPVQKQMEVIQRYRLPATWLLQYDAMAMGPFVDYLKKEMPAYHEVGLWFEMNEAHCKAAGVDWRGRPGYEWDWAPSVAFSIGYAPEERIALADAAAKKHIAIWGRNPSSVASWNLDSVTIAHFIEAYGVKAFAVCRDQIATDGFTIWGAPIAGYFPSKQNCWSPALEAKNQLGAPIFRMLGQDPVYYYDKTYPLPNGHETDHPDTMEPVWIAGQSRTFVDRFFEMIVKEPSLHFAYAQLGQENSFGWPAMAEGYEMQMAKLAELSSRRAVTVRTMGDTGKTFAADFRQTPAQAQVQLQDPFGNTPPERTVWYQSRFYRANLHFRGDVPFFRDLTIYNDRFPQPFLDLPTRAQSVDQRLPAVLDGYHWSSEGKRAGGFLRVDSEDVRVIEPVEVVERDAWNTLTVQLTMLTSKKLSVQFREGELEILADRDFSLCFEWDPAKSAFESVVGNEARYVWEGFDYSARVKHGSVEQKADGWTVHSVGHRLLLGTEQD